MIDRILGQSAIRRKVLRILFENPQERFTVGRLNKLVNHAHTPIRKELGLLEAEGLVVKIIEANRHAFQANAAYKHLKEIKAALDAWTEPGPAGPRERGRGRPRQSRIRSLEEELRAAKERGRALEAELASAKAALAKALAPKPAPADDEPRGIECAQCFKLFKVHVGDSGKLKCCPHCRHLHRVPDYRAS